MSSTGSTQMEELNHKNLTKVSLEIGNFQNDTNHKAKDFCLSSANKIKFRLYCEPHCHNGFGYYNTLVYLYLDSCDKEQVNVRYRLSLLNVNGDKCETQEGFKNFSKKSEEVCGANLIISRDYILKQENGLLVNGKLTICCELEEIKDTFDNIKNEEVKPGLPDNQIVGDYQSLLESGKFSDASLIVKIGEKKLLVHKAILSARSKVFAAMFENDCEEKRQNRVEIIDISAEVCEQMLSYIYTGKIPDMDKYAADLFVAADKYQLEHLKAVCEKYLSTKIDIESSANTLLIADMHHAELLKSKAIDFIVDNTTKVMATEGWKALASRAELVVDLLQKMAIKTNR